MGASRPDLRRRISGRKRNHDESEYTESLFEFIARMSIQNVYLNLLPERNQTINDCNINCKINLLTY